MVKKKLRNIFPMMRRNAYTMFRWIMGMVMIKKDGEKP
jgi:hypothetical protein